MSDLDLSNQECGEENEQAWNEDPGPVVMNLFIANTSLVRDVQGYQPLTFNLMFKDSNFDGIAEETNGYAQKEMDPAWCKTDAEEVKAFFTLNILLGIKQRYPVKSPTFQLANANLLTCKIKWRRQRVGLQSSTNYY